MPEDAAAGEPSQAPAPGWNWRVWGVWFGVALIPWVIISAEDNVVSVFLYTAGSLSYIYNVALEVWDTVLYLMLVPFIGYFVQKRLRSFDLTGIFVMTLAAGLLVGILPIPITMVCRTSAPSTCSYQFELNVYSQSYDVVYAIANALGVSLVMLAGAFLSQWRRGAIAMASPVRSQSFLLAAWSVIGFLAVGVRLVAWAPANAIFGNNYYLVFPPSTIQLWYGGVSLLAGPVLALLLGYFLYARLHEVGMKELFLVVALGGMLAYVISQATHGISVSQLASVVLGAINMGVLSAWMVLSGSLLFTFENKRARSKEIGAVSAVPRVQPMPMAVPILALGSAVAFGSYVAGIYFQAALSGASPGISKVANLGASFGLSAGLFLVVAGLVVLYWERRDMRALE